MHKDTTYYVHMNATQCVLHTVHIDTIQCVCNDTVHCILHTVYMQVLHTVYQGYCTECTCIHGHSQKPYSACWLIHSRNDISISPNRQGTDRYMVWENVWPEKQKKHQSSSQKTAVLNPVMSPTYEGDRTQHNIVTGVLSSRKCHWLRKRSIGTKVFYREHSLDSQGASIKTCGWSPTTAQRHVADSLPQRKDMSDPLSQRKDMLRTPYHNTQTCGWSPTTTQIYAADPLTQRTDMWLIPYHNAKKCAKSCIGVHGRLHPEVQSGAAQRIRDRADSDSRRSQCWWRWWSRWRPPRTGWSWWRRWPERKWSWSRTSPVCGWGTESVFRVPCGQLG